MKAILSGREPSDLPPYIMQVRNNAAYVGGTGIIDLGQFTRGFGRHLVDRVALPDHYIYLTLDEYLPQELRLEIGLTASNAEIVMELVRAYPTREMLAELAFLNRCRQQPDLLARVRHDYLQGIHVKAAARCAAMTAETQSEPRQLLARQPILLAMREVLLANATGDTNVTMPIGVAAVMLTHAIAADLGMEPGPDIWDGMPSNVLMEVVCNGSFNATDDLFSRLDRFRRIYLESATAPSPPARRSFVDMATEALGADVASIVLLGAILDTSVRSWHFPEPIYTNLPFVTDARPEDLNAFLSFVSADQEQLRTALESQQGPWAFLPFERAPALRLDNRLLVLDQEFLQRRFTEGVIWAVADYERHQYGLKASRDWLPAHGQAVEAAAREQIRRLSPAIPVVGESRHQQTYFTDRDLITAYPASKKGHTPAHSDAAVWLPAADCLLVVEIVTAELKLPTRQGQELEAFRDDVERMVVKKLRQIDSTARAVLKDGGAKLLGVPNHSISVQPVLVQGGHFPMHPATVAFIEDRMKREHLLEHARIRRLAVVHLDELDILETVVDRGDNLLPLISEWQRSERKAQPLKNFMFSRGRNERSPRLSQERLQLILDELTERALLAPMSSS